MITPGVNGRGFRRITLLQNVYVRANVTQRKIVLYIKYGTAQHSVASVLRNYGRGLIHLSLIGLIHLPCPYLDVIHMAITAEASIAKSLTTHFS